MLERFLALLAVPRASRPSKTSTLLLTPTVLWSTGLAAWTRRGYVQVFKDFHRFLVARKAPEIEATFGVTLRPLDEFNASRHVGNDSPSAKPPPSLERMEEFFAFLRDRVATAGSLRLRAGTTPCSGRFITPGCGRKRLLAGTGRPHFGRGPFGKIHVRLGKGTRGLWPPAALGPDAGQLDLVLRWFVDDVRPRCRER